MAKAKAPVTAGQMIRKRKNNLGFRRDCFGLLARFILFLIALILVFTVVFMLRQAQGNDMFPTIKDGDLLLAYRLEAEYNKDEVVIYHANGEVYVGRIVARGGDIVNITESGSLIVSGTTQSGEIMYPTYPKEDITYPYKVPHGSVFILSDYRTQCTDSRDFGAVEEDNIYGKIITILRRREI